MFFGDSKNRYRRFISRKNVFGPLPGYKKFESDPLNSLELFRQSVEFCELFGSWFQKDHQFKMVSSSGERGEAKETVLNEEENVDIEDAREALEETYSQRSEDPSEDGDGLCQSD